MFLVPLVELKTPFFIFRNMDQLKTKIKTKKRRG
jgi:hypothetical protein